MATDVSPRRFRGVGLAAAFGAALVVLSGAGDAPRPVTAQEPKKADPGGAKAAGHALAGIGQCVLCHSIQDAAKNPGAQLFVKAGSTKFVRLDENLTWSSYDLHSRAYQNLDPKVNKIAEQMQEVLAKHRPAGYTLNTDAACLACHATLKETTTPPAKRKADESFDTVQGVSCEMCHGYASDWLAPHAKIEQVGGKSVIKWREFTREAKHGMGLTDLRDPAVRAETCASCHVGDGAAGRFVTHEMFAAGHPPLPPVDVMAYARDQPRHWGIPRELPVLTAAADADPDRCWKLYKYRPENNSDKGEVYAARQFAASTVGAFRASVRLLAQLADGSDAGGLDYAAFDCYACHHDLKFPSARQKRGYVGVPGRPTPRAAPAALARVVVRHAAGMEGGKTLDGALARLDAMEKELAAAFAAKSLGDPTRVKAAAGKMEKWAEDVGGVIDAVRYTRADAIGLAKAVAAAGADEKNPVADPEVGELLTWAAITLLSDLADAGAAGAGDPPAVAALRAEVGPFVVTRLRPDPMKKKPAKVRDPLDPTNTVNETPVPVEDVLRDRLRTFNAFGPDAFRKAFKTKLEPVVNGLKAK